MSCPLPVANPAVTRIHLWTQVLLPPKRAIANNVALHGQLTLQLRAVP